MARRTKSVQSCRLCLVVLGWMAAHLSAPAQECAPSLPLAVPVKPVSPTGADSEELFHRLSKMEQRLDWLMQQNDALLRENRVLTDKPAAGTGPFGSSAFQPVWPPGVSGEPDGTGDGSRSGSGRPAGGGSDPAPTSTGGGRSLSGAAGGDPTAVGRAQEGGNLHLGQVPLHAYYDFDSAGYHLETADKEFSIGVTGLTQLDGMLYARPTPGVETSSG
ncbi:MAG TPA: hypothetical protein VH120_02645, partial [Gemmataceae bacterium]|nr:hypothetical protein [Gemmataceae bacterium]